MQGYIQPGVVPFNAQNQIASGAITSGDLAYDIILSGHIVSRQIGFVHLTDDAVLSGIIGSGQITSFHISSGRLTGFELGSGSIISGRVASGQIGFGHLADASVQSGTVAALSVASGHLASGLQAYLSWGTETFTAFELISGFRAVCLTSGGLAVLAMAGSGLRLPAIGIAPDSTVSGAAATVIRFGKLITTSGMDLHWSGRVGRHLYVGSGGAVVAQGLLVSGQSWQKLGFAVSGGLLVSIDPAIFSGGVVGPAGTF